MMKLRSSGPSPFGRKVKIAAAVLGLAAEIELIQTDTAAADGPLRKDNPLGKIPALLLEDGRAVYDSRVIVECLDLRAGGGRVIPSESRERITALTLQALADGMMDASILQVYEARWRDAARREQAWLDHQAGKVARALASLEASPPMMPGSPHVGHIAVACALGYLDFRFEGAWRDAHPRLVAWLDVFAEQVPAFAETRPA